MGNHILTIGHGNGRNKMSLVQFMRASNADSFSAQEAQMLVDEFRRIPGHRVTVAGDDYAEARNRARSTLIITSSRFENLGEITRKVSERIPHALRVAPDRVLVGSFYKHPVARRLGYEGVAHFSLHPDAGPEQLNGNDPKAPIVREYREALHSTKLFMRTAVYDGLLPILTGDLQVREGHNKPWGPVAMIAKPMDLEYASVGLDWVLFDKSLKRGPLRLRKLFDHTGFTVDFIGRPQ